MRLGVLVAFSVLLLGSSCGGNADKSLSAPQAIATIAGAPRSFTPDRIASARAELKLLPVPAGADAAAFEQLRAELDTVLTALAHSKRSSILPAGPAHGALQITSGAGEFALEWTYRNAGDYSLDGEVNISDLTPLGVNLGKTADSPDWASAQTADGDGNGVVAISDLTPIGANLFAQVSGYNIYGGASETGPWELVEAVPIGAGTAGFPKQFSYSLGASPTYAWYTVAPYDSTGEDALGDESAKPGALINLGADVTLVEQTIGVGGGVLNGPAGSPIEGVTLDIPAAAFQGDTQISLGYNDGSVQPITGRQHGSIIEITSDYGMSFEEPVAITAPFSGDAEAIPIPFYINPSGRLQYCEVSTVNWDAATLTFLTWHASPYVVLEALLNEPLSPFYDTGFAVERDGFQVVNNGSTWNAKGECAGMTTWAQWWFWYMKNQGNGNFFPRFMYDVGTGGILSGQDIIATRAHNSINFGWKKIYDDKLAWQAEEGFTQAQEWLVMLYVMVNSGEPIVISCYEAIDDSRHSILGYAFVNDDLFVYDPNAPGDTSPKLHFNGTGFGAFDDHKFYGRFNTCGTGSFDTGEPFYSIYVDALLQFQSPKARVEITSPESGSTVTTQDVTVSGVVRSGEVEVKEIRFSRDGDEKPTVFQVDDSGSFEGTLRLKQGENHFTVRTFGYASGNSTHLVPVSSDIENSKGYHLTGVFVPEESEEPILVIVERTTHQSTSLEDENVSLFLYAFDPDGEFGAQSAGEGKVYDEGGGGGYLYTVPAYMTTSYFLWGDAEIQYGVEYKLRVGFQRGSFGGDGPMGYTLTIYKNLVSPHPGVAALHEDPAAYEWESTESFSGSIAEPQAPPWDIEGDAPGLSEFHFFTPTLPGS